MGATESDHQALQTIRLLNEEFMEATSTKSKYRPILEVVEKKFNRVILKQGHP